MTVKERIEEFRRDHPGLEVGEVWVGGRIADEDDLEREYTSGSYLDWERGLNPTTVYVNLV